VGNNVCEETRSGSWWEKGTRRIIGTDKRRKSKRRSLINKLGYKRRKEEECIEKRNDKQRVKKGDDKETDIEGEYGKSVRFKINLKTIYTCRNML
jgi:hypothetical protein